MTDIVYGITLKAQADGSFAGTLSAGKKAFDDLGESAKAAERASASASKATADALKAAQRAQDEAASATARARETLESYIIKQRIEVETLGFTNAKLREYHAIRLGATSADLAAIRALNDQQAAYERNNRAKEQGSINLNSLKTAALAYVGVAALVGAARNWIAEADSITLVNARLKQATTTGEEFLAVKAQLYAAAQRLGGSYAELAQATARMAPAIREMGGGAKEAAKLAEIIVSTAKIQGASATEATASAIQFAQALGSGVLQGDELKSILENNQKLARVLAEGLGVTVGELKKMGEAGELSSYKVANAVLASYAKIQAEAANIPETFAAGLQRIKNASGQAIDAMNQQYGVTQILGGAATALATALDEQRQAAVRDGISQEELKNVMAAVAITVASVVDGFGYLVDVGKILVPVVKTITFGALALSAAMQGNVRDSAAYGEVAVQSFKDVGAAIGDTAGKWATQTSLADRVVDVMSRVKVSTSGVTDEQAKLTQGLGLAQRAFDDANKGVKTASSINKEYEKDLQRVRAAAKDLEGAMRQKGSSDQQIAAVSLQLAQAETALNDKRKKDLDSLTSGQRKLYDAQQQVLVQMREKSAALQEELQYGRALTDSEKVLIAVQEGKYKKLGPLTVAAIANTARENTLIEAQIALRKDRNKANEEEVRLREADLRKVQDMISGLEDENDNIQFQTSLLTLSNAEREKQISLRQRKIDLASTDSAQDKVAINNLYDQRDALVANRDAVQKNQEIFKGWYDVIDSGFKAALGGAKSFTDYLKNTLKQVLYDLIARPFIIQIAGQLSGSGGGGGWGGVIASFLGGSGGTGGAVASAAGGGTQGYTSLLSTAFQQSGIGQQIQGYIGSYFGGGATTSVGGGQIASGGWVSAEAGTGYAATSGSGAAGAGGASSAAASAASVAALYVAAAYSVYQSYQRWGNDNTGRAGVLGGAAAGAAIGTAIFPVIGTAIGAVIGALLGGAGFGRRAINNDARGIQGNIDFQSGANGQNYQDLSQRGGWFRRDRRWTETSPLTADQLDPLVQASSAIRGLAEAMGELRGVNVKEVLANYSKPFKIETKDKKPEEIQKAIDDLLKSVLSDEIVASLGEINGRVTERIKEFKGNFSELAIYVGKLAASFEFVKAIRDGRVGDSLTNIGNTFRTGIDANTVSALTAASAQIESMVANLESLAADGDLVGAYDVGQQIYTQMQARYQAELQLIQKLQQGISALQSEAYQFNLSIGQKINSLGGKQDIAGYSANRAGQLRNTITNGLTIDDRQAGVREYVSVLDNWYATRAADITRNAEAQAQSSQAQLEAYKAVQTAAAEFRQKEADALLAMQGVADALRRQLQDTALSDANPLHALGRYELSKSYADDAKAAFEASSGGDRQKRAQEYADALTARLALLGQTSQRPSTGYREEYNDITARRQALLGESESDVVKGLRLQEEAAALATYANSLSAQNLGAQNIANAGLQQLNDEFRVQYEWAQEEFSRNNAEQQRLLNELLAETTGGKDPQIYLAQRANDQVALLERIATALENGAKPTTGTTKPTTPTGGGTTTENGGGGGGGKPSAQPNQKLVIALDGKVFGEIMMSQVKSRATDIALALDRAG
jgi:tape measure domain-containing protein